MPVPPFFTFPFSSRSAPLYPGNASHLGQRQPQKLLAHLMPREHYHDSRNLRLALALTTEQLGSETRRADDAERRVTEVLRTLRLQHDATMLAQAELSRAKEELTMYKFRLEEAQREIIRANEAIGDLQQERDMAQDEAARARATARKFREQQLIACAREEGRKQGMREGLSRGTSLGSEGVAVAESSKEREYASAPTIEEMLEEEEPRTPRVQQPALLQPHQSLSRSTISRANQSTHIPDTAHFAATQPVPTLTTPLNVPLASRSHSLTRTPTRILTPHPALPSLGHGEIPPPIPIYEPTSYSSPRRPRVDLPPDGWIPYATERNEEILLPPPHEFSRPATPVSPLPPILQPAARAQPAWSSSALLPPSRNIYSGVLQEGPTATMGKPMSQSSKAVSASQASTSISQFDLIRAPPRAKRQFPTWGRPPGEDVLPPLGLRPGERVTMPARLRVQERSRGSEFIKRVEREKDRPATNPLEKLFKKRRRNQSPPIAPPVIPDPITESPSTSSTGDSWIELTDPHPALTIPEPATQTIVLSASQDNVIATHVESPGHHPTTLLDQLVIPSPPDSPAEPVIPPLGDQLPPGFGPLTPRLPPETPSANPIPALSDMPTPFPPPSNLVPSPIPPPPIEPSVPPKETAPASTLHAPDAPLPSPESENALVPVSQRGAGTNASTITSSPRQGRHDEALIPATAVYQPPLSRSGTRTPMSSFSPASESRPVPSLRPVSSDANLSPLQMESQLFAAPLRSDMTPESIHI